MLFSAALHAGAFVTYWTSAPVNAQARQIDVQLVEAEPPKARPNAAGQPAGSPSRAQAIARARTAAAKAKAAVDTRKIAEIVRAGEAVGRGATGAWISLLLRFDRLRGSKVSQDAELLAQRLPILGDIAAANGGSLLETFDQVRISTVGLAGRGTVLLVARHRMSEAGARTALRAAAEARGYRSVERSAEGVDVFEWRRNGAETGAPPEIGPPDAGAARTGNAEERLVLLPEPGLMVIAERSLLGSFATAGSSSGNQPSLRERLAALTSVGDQPEEALPSNAVGVVSISNLPEGGPPPETDLMLGGRPMPHTLLAVLQLDPAPSLDIVGEFSQETSAAFWDSRWRASSDATRAALFGWPLHLLPLTRGATMSRRGQAVHVHEAVARADLEGSLLLSVRLPDPVASTGP